MKPSTRVAGTFAALAIASGSVACGTRLDDATIQRAAHGSPATGVAARSPVPEAPDTGGAEMAPGGNGTAAVDIDAATDDITGDAAGPGQPGAGPAATGRPSATRPPGAAGTGTPSPTPAGGPTTGVRSGAPATAGPGAAANPGTGAALPPVVIGHVGDYSGIVGSVTGAGAPMAQVTARWINDHGGLAGHPIKLLAADAAGDPARALSLVRDLVENKGAVAFMGNVWPLSAGGPRSYLEEKGVPVIGGDVTSELWFQSPMFFPAATGEQGVAAGAVSSAVEAARPKIGSIYCAEVPACRIWHDAAVRHAPGVGGEIVYQAQVSLAQPDFTAECIQARRSGAEALMLGVDSTALSRLARSCFQQGYRPMLITGNLAVVADTSEDPNLDGLVVPVGTFPYVATGLPGVDEYRQAIDRYAPTLTQGPVTSLVWTAGALLREVSRSLPAQVGSADFLAGLHQVKNNTLGGLAPPLTFVAGAPAPQIRCYFVQVVTSGRWVAPHGSNVLCPGGTP